MVYRFVLQGSTSATKNAFTNVFKKRGRNILPRPRALCYSNCRSLFQLPRLKSVNSWAEDVSIIILGTLRNHNGNANENVAWKYKFALLVLLRDYFNSFNLYNVSKLSSNRIGNGVQVETEIKKITVTRSRSPQNFEFGYFTFGRARCIAFFFLIISYCFVTFSLPLS